MTQIYDSPTSSSDTELDSPRESLSSLTGQTQGPIIQLSTSVGDSTIGEGGDLYRNASNASFFNSVFLDMPDIKQTRPLRVKKRVAPVRPARMRRRSTLSLPRSPRSPTTPTHLPLRSPILLNPTAPPTELVRDNSTASSAHRAITQSFFALSPSHLAPSPTSCPALSPAGSEMHLGLGNDTSLLPGPSPPISPLADPSIRSPSISGLLSPFTSADISTTPSKPLPSPPLTPSRAPCKAAKLLGTNPPPIPSHRPLGKGKSIANLLRPTDLPKRANKDHYRPLPEATLVDIQRFFGDVPKKSKPPVLANKVERGKETATSIAARVGSDMPTVKKGRGIGYEREGREWMDTEEEMEFAWLMSDLTVDLSQRRRRIIERAAGLDGEKGMKSVLDMPQPGRMVKGKKEDKTVKIKKEKMGKKVFESFLDLGLDNNIDQMENKQSGVSGRTSSEAVRPAITARTISNPLPPPYRPNRPSRPSDLSLASRSVSSPVKPVTQPIPVRHRNQGSNADPPVRPKHRPPPLNLRLIPPQKDLPIVTSLSPSQLRPSHPNLIPQGAEPTNHKPSINLDSPLIVRVSRPIPDDIPNSASSGEFDNPNCPSRKIDDLMINPPLECRTPFKHPRRAPKPVHLPAIQVLVPDLPISTRNGPAHMVQTAQVDISHVDEKAEMSCVGYGYGYGYEGEGVSYFEPITPTAPVGPGLGGGVKAGKEWLKRVVRM